MKRKIIISAIALLVVVSTMAMTGCSMFFDLLNNTGTTTENRYTIDVTDLEGSSIAEIVAANTINAAVLVYTDKATGAGFFVHESGYVVTNSHVIASGSHYSIKTASGKEFSDVELKAHDPVLDLAILKVNTVGEKFDYMTFDTSTGLRYGQTAFTIGNPSGKGLLFAKATVANPSLPVTGKLDEPYNSIYIDSNINHGNSGGALINADSKVIGVVYGRIESNDTEYNNVYGLGTAIPSDVAMKYLDDHSTPYYKVTATTEE
ncbi:MAG: S1C family serine protease [Christensenellales bacterium]